MVCRGSPVLLRYLKKWVGLECDGRQHNSVGTLGIEPYVFCPQRGWPRLSWGVSQHVQMSIITWDLPVSLKGLMLQDLISAKLVSDYIVVEIPDSVNDLQGTVKVKFILFKGLLGYLLISLPFYLECYLSG